MRAWIAVIFLFSFNLLASEWAHLEIGRTYKLNQSFELPIMGERSRPSLSLLKNEKFKLKDIMGLDMLRVSLFSFEFLNCPGYQLKTDMEIIPVKSTSPVVEVGAQLEINCKLEVFIENKDLMTKSLFE